MHAVRERLADAPVPETAIDLAQGVLSATIEGTDDSLALRLADCDDARAGALAQRLFAICGIAPFLAAIFRRHPAWLLELLDDDLSVPRDVDVMRSSLAALKQRAGDESPDQLLRHFKYKEIARIVSRDADEQLVPLDESEKTLREITALADVILEHAIGLADEQVRAQLGPPVWRTRDGAEAPLGFCVLGLGKLGSDELNFSSDVDLVYVHDAPAEPLAQVSRDEAGETFAHVTPPEYFSRLAQTFGRLVGAVTADGFLYRIDLELRPEGAQGPLVTSEAALESYYETSADTWERAAFMKARPVAGDHAVGWRAIKNVDPMIYRSMMDFRGVESIRSLKHKVEQAHGGREEGFNVKIDPGGIRDIEFIAQSLQLIHGGRIAQVRERSTARALRRLGEVGLLPSEQVDALLEAYRFLRRTENRIQMEGELQRHRVPSERGALRRLARAMGFVSGEESDAFERELDRVRASVLSLFEGSFSDDSEQRIMELFERNNPKLMMQPGVRRMIEALAMQFARAIEGAVDPQRSLNNLDRFIQSVGGRSFYYELLLDRPELVPRLTALFSASRFLSSYLAAQPRLIEPVFQDPNVLLLGRDELRADMADTLRDAGDDTELVLDGLRNFQHRQVLNVGLLDIAAKVKRPEVETALSDIAEVCLEEALDQARRALEQSSSDVPESARRGQYLVVGMGKLGTRELSYGSDLDLIFLYDLPEDDQSGGPMAQHYFVRVTQRLISNLQTATSTGACYEIDARLRPSGSQGSLVTSRAAFVRYHEQSAEVWERQALLRARPIAGDEQLSARFDALRADILRKPLPDDIDAQIGQVRQRMEEELANETGQRRNFKTGRGGLLDVETIVQCLALKHGGDHPELHEPRRTEAQLASLAEHGLLTREDAECLESGWDFLQNLGKQLRIADNRSISDLDGERGDLDGIAQHLGYEAAGREAGPRRSLLEDYQRTTDAIRETYERVMRARSSD
jgi:glutamate-ammonia-ligase adenylyltransferase